MHMTDPPSYKENVHFTHMKSHSEAPMLSSGEAAEGSLGKKASEWRVVNWSVDQIGNNFGINSTEERWALMNGQQKILPATQSVINNWEEFCLRQR